jgi:hypothetical protein
MRIPLLTFVGSCYIIVFHGLGSSVGALALTPFGSGLHLFECSLFPNLYLFAISYSCAEIVAGWYGHKTGCLVRLKYCQPDVFCRGVLACVRDAHARGTIKIRF